MKAKRFAPCSLGRNTICLGKQGEANHLRIEFDCSGWLAEFPDGVIVLYHFPAGKKSADKPHLETVGTDRVWTVSAEDTVYAGDGVIELVLEDAETGAVLKSATGYTNVIYSHSAAQPVIDDGDGGNDNEGGAGTPGEDGGYYRPNVSSSGVLSWQPSKSGMPSVPSSNIKGPQGERGATGATGPQGPTGPQGEAGAQGPEGPAGADGETGPQGPAGADGVSPTISVTKITGGHRVTITDKNGTKYFDVMDGAAGSGDGSGGGEPGQDGFSPIVSVIAINGGHRISITDATGTSEFDVMDGEDGAQGPAGPQGEPGATGPAGPQGETGPEGPRGPAGANGAGASASVTAITGGHRVTIVSASGTVSFDVMNGEDGNAGDIIDDTTPSAKKVYSSQKTQYEIGQLSQQKADKAGWTPNKLIGTDAEGNLVAQDQPEDDGGNAETLGGKPASDYLLKDNAYDMKLLYLNPATVMGDSAIMELSGNVKDFDYLLFHIRSLSGGSLLEFHPAITDTGATFYTLDLATNTVLQIGIIQCTINETTVIHSKRRGINIATSPSVQIFNDVGVFIKEIYGVKGAIK